MLDKLIKNKLAIGKFLVTVSLVLMIVLRTDWVSVKISFLEANLEWVLFSVAVYFPSMYLSCWRWKLVLESQKITIRVRNLVKSYWIGQFAGNFLPSTVGADLFRAHDQSANINNLTISTISVIIDRLVGYTGLNLLGLTLSATLQPTLEEPQHELYIIILLSISAILISALFYPQKLISLLPSVFRNSKSIQNYEKWIHQQNKNKIPIIKALVLSLLTHIVSTVGSVANLLAINTNIKLKEAIPMIIYTDIVSAIPISINSLGVRESTYIYLMSTIDISEEKALSAALLGRFILLILSFGGATLYIADGINKNRITSNVKNTDQ